MRDRRWLVGSLALSLACGRGSAGCDQAPTNSAQQQGMVPPGPVDSAPPIQGFRITSLEARLYGPDSTPVTANLIDNPDAKLLFNAAHLPVGFIVTVKWTPTETLTARLAIWARARGQTIFEQDVTIV